MPDSESPTRIYLLRHGPVAPDSLNSFNGSTDSPLDPELGPAKAALAADYLTDAPPDFLYASPLSRCVDTARVLADRYDLEIETVSDLREMDFGVLDGLNFDQARTEHGPDLARWFQDIGNFRFPGGETMAEVQTRSWPALTQLADRHPGHRVAVVAHGAVNRLLVAKVLELPIQKVMSLAMDYASLTIIDFFPDGPIVKGINIQPGPTLPPEPVDHS